MKIRVGVSDDEDARLLKRCLAGRETLRVTFSDPDSWTAGSPLREGYLRVYIAWPRGRKLLREALRAARKHEPPPPGGEFVPVWTRITRKRSVRPVATEV